MAQIDGKQVRDESVSLDKLRGTTGLVTFSQSATMSFESGSSLRVSFPILDGDDVVNKNYVDAVAQGLHVKEAVYVISNTQSITLSGTGSFVDGRELLEDDRILVNAQAGPGNPTSSNGIYIVSAGSWSRSEDSDSNPSGEVSEGDFVFVRQGVVYATSGWVLSTTDAVDHYNILAGTDSQLWTQFSQAGVLSAGEGLIQSGTNLNVNTGIGLTISTIDNTVLLDFNSITGTGLTQNGSVISIDSNEFATTLAGDGLSANGGTLSVNVGNGISLDGDVVVLGGTLSQNTTINGSQSYSFIIDEISDFGLSFSGSATISVGGLTQGLVYSATPSSATPLTLIHKEYVDNQIGDLAEVDGVSIILDGNNQISISATISGHGLTYSSSTGIMDINWGGTSSGLTFSANNELKVNVDGTSIFINSNGELQGLELQSGQGLTYSNNVMDINWGGTSSGLTFSANNELKVNVDDSTIIVNNSGQLQVVAGSSQPVYDQFTSLATFGDNYQTGATLSYIPNSYSRIQVYVNGQLQRLGDGASSSVDCYFDASGKTLNSLASGDELYWNGVFAGFDLSNSDKIDIIYES